MAINVNFQPDAGLLSQVAQETGFGQFQTQERRRQENFDFDRENREDQQVFQERLLGLRQNFQRDMAQLDHRNRINAFHEQIAAQNDQVKFQFSEKQRQQQETLMQQLDLIEQRDDLNDAERQYARTQIYDKLLGITPNPALEDDNPYPAGQGIQEVWTNDQGVTFTRNDDGNVKKIAGSIDDNEAKIKMQQDKFKFEMERQQSRNEIDRWKIASELMKQVDEKGKPVYTPEQAMQLLGIQDPRQQVQTQQQGPTAAQSFQSQLGFPVGDFVDGVAGSIENIARQFRPVAQAWAGVPPLQQAPNQGGGGQWSHPPVNQPSVGQFLGRTPEALPDAQRQAAEALNIPDVFELGQTQGSDVAREALMGVKVGQPFRVKGHLLIKRSYPVKDYLEAIVIDPKDPQSVSIYENLEPGKKYLDLKTGRIAVKSKSTQKDQGKSKLTPMMMAVPY